jgi:hypothetical protein
VIQSSTPEHIGSAQCGEWIRTFAIITTDANELVAEIHDRMPLILAPADYVRWLSDEPDPHRQELAKSPPFDQIARRNDFNAEMLAYLILSPHPRMNIALSREESDDLAAYIASLRR